MKKALYEKVGELNGEKIVSWINCSSCEDSFAVFEKDYEFYDQISPIFNGEKFVIPLPTKCPTCRIIQASCFINDNILYKRKCDITGKPVVGAYSENKDFVVYSSEAWLSDKWNAMDYGMDFDFDKGFFEQFNILFQKVPKINYKTINAENSDYSLGLNLKNCYIVLIGVGSQNCCYGERIIESSDCFDCSNIKNCSLCYECIDSSQCYNCFYLENSENSQNCYFSNNLINCQNCIFCSNLANKQYYINNKLYSKEDYEVIYGDLMNKIGNNQQLNFLINEYEKLSNNSIRKSLNIINSEKSIGYSIENCQNVNFVNLGNNSKNCRYSRMNNNGCDCYDTDAYQSNLCYQVHYGMNNYNSLFCFPYFENNKNLIYSMFCQNSDYLFGCVGLKNKQYCILNKQYTKQEYEIIVGKIIQKMQKDGEWGEFFPISMSPFGYNETPAYEIQPLTQQQAVSKGFNWEEKDFPINIPEGIELLDKNNIDSNIQNIDESILTKALICEETGKPFRITKLEFDFYKKYNISLPRKHYYQRHLQRLKKRNLGIELYIRKCDKCDHEIISQYNDISGFKVYCESCYNELMY